MSKILKIYWQEPIKHQRLHVGTLSFSDGVYKFKYVNNYKDLEQRGFKPIMPFQISTPNILLINYFLHFLLVFLTQKEKILNLF